MGGLARICKLLGGIKIASYGQAVEYVWDYANDKSVPKDKMPVGSPRWKASEQAKWETFKRETASRYKSTGPT